MRSMCVGVAETGVKAFLFLTFAALLVIQKREKSKKLLYDSSRETNGRPLPYRAEILSASKAKN